MKESKNLIQWMEEEIKKKENCITQYNTIREKEHTNVINNPCKSKSGVYRASSRVVCVIWCVLVWPLNRNTLWNFVSPAVNYCHYACDSTKVTVRSIHVMYRYSPSLPTIYNYHPSPLIISILPHNIIAVHHKQKTDTQTVPAPVQLHYVLHRKASWNTECVSKCRIYMARSYTYIYAITDC